MKTSRIILITAVLAVLSLLSVAVLMAQDSTPEATAMPSSFSDHRINGDIFLGGLAIYCEDENGSTDTTSFDKGGMTVWGPDGQKYIELTVNQLRGNEEIPQPPPTMMPGATEEAMAEVTAEAMPTEIIGEGMSPLLLARANTVNGEVWLFRVGDNVFALQGNDNTGKFFTYTWTGCSMGNLSTNTTPFAGVQMPTSAPMMESTEMATPVSTQAPVIVPTVEVTTSP